MDLQSRLAQELLESMKQRDAVRTSTLRMVISALRAKEIERRKALTDPDVLEVISAEAKMRKESISEYQKGGRTELAAKEEAELAILQSYLPKPLSAAELRTLVESAIQSTGAKAPQDMGRVMSALMPQIRGRADGKQTQQLVQQLLKN